MIVNNVQRMTKKSSSSCIYSLLLLKKLKFTLPYAMCLKKCGCSLKS